VDKKCKTCGWGCQIPNEKMIMMCGCHLSGCFKTDVMVDDGKGCDTWKKAADEYLRAIGEIK
jgi:hypothetical protein